MNKSDFDSVYKAEDEKRKLRRMERIKSMNKYIDLKTNGRLFPTWVLANFRKYKLPEIMQSDDDPCKKKITKQELHKYQEFLGKYLDYRSPHHDVLIYHGLGSGKTVTAINIYNILYNYNPGWNVFILTKATLREVPWMRDLKSWLSKDEYEFRFKNIIFVHYDSPIADRQFLDAVKNSDSSKKSMYIIEEAHNFIRNVYSNISSGAGKRALTVYDHIIQDKRENEGTRVLCLSGTPAINTPYELALLFNLLRPGSFSKVETDFNQMYISDSVYPTINKKHKNMFQRRIMGLVSYYIGATPDMYATQKVHYVDVEMSKYQREIYRFFENIEETLAKKARGKSGNQVYKSYTRQASNFVFPALSQNVTGENRPRPNKFRISEREALKLAEGRESKLKAEKDSDKFMNVSQYTKALETYVTSMDQYLGNAAKEDEEAGHTVQDDFKVYKDKYQNDFNAFNEKQKKTSKVYKLMYDSSPKFINIIFTIFLSSGPVLVYSNYVMMEGLEMFKLYLKYFGFHNVMKQKPVRGVMGYVEYHGGIKDRAERKRALDIYNDINNIKGEYVKVIMISPAGAEGLSLANTRQVHIIEPYWHEVRIVQMVGRAIRQCSHKDLPLEERHVDVYRYKSVRKGVDKWTTDQHIEDLARSKEGLIQSFLDTLKEVAVDCVLFKEHNMMRQEYRCFQFEEPSLFDKQIGPAYKEDLYDDAKIDNGSNSIHSMTVKVKVMKIRAVVSLNKDMSKLSTARDYWYYDKTGVVYDYELHYPVGKVAVDDSGLPMKQDSGTYIIDQTVPIPLIDMN